MDSLDNIKGGKKMPSIKIGTENFELDEKTCAAITGHIAVLNNKISEAQKSSDNFEALNDAKDTELHKMKESAKNPDYTTFLEFRSLIDDAEQYLPKKRFDSIDFNDSFNIPDLKRQILGERDPRLKEKYQSKSDEFINHAYEVFNDFLPATAGSGKDFGQSLTDSRDRFSDSNDDGYADQAKRSLKRHKSYQ
jgi:hypothetical protein